MTTRPVPPWIRAKIASHESLASSTPFLPEHIVEDDGGDDDDGDNSVARPVKEVLGHLEILQLDCWMVTNEHPKHLLSIIIIFFSSPSSWTSRYRDIDQGHHHLHHTVSSRFFWSPCVFSSTPSSASSPWALDQWSGDDEGPEESLVAAWAEKGFNTMGQVVGLEKTG